MEDEDEGEDEGLARELDAEDEEDMAFEEETTLLQREVVAAAIAAARSQLRSKHEPRRVGAEGGREGRPAKDSFVWLMESLRDRALAERTRDAAEAAERRRRARSVERARRSPSWSRDEGGEVEIEEEEDEEEMEDEGEEEEMEEAAAVEGRRGRQRRPRAAKEDEWRAPVPWRERNEAQRRADVARVQTWLPTTASMFDAPQVARPAPPVPVFNQARLPRSSSPPPSSISTQPGTAPAAVTTRETVEAAYRRAAGLG